MRSSYFITLLALLLVACTIPPDKTFDQKLSESRSPAERKEILRLACLNEAEWPVRSRKPFPYGHRAVHSRQEQLQHKPEVRQMKALCRQMDDLTAIDANERQSPRTLARMCATQVAVKKQNAGGGWAEHAKRIAAICKEMTGHDL